MKTIKLTLIFLIGMALIGCSGDDSNNSNSSNTSPDVTAESTDVESDTDSTNTAQTDATESTDDQDIQSQETELINLHVPLDAPQNFSIFRTGILDRDVQMNWDAVDKALSYNVYRYDTQLENFVNIASVEATEYLDKFVATNQAQQYYVTAVDELGLEGNTTEIRTVSPFTEPGGTPKVIGPCPATQVDTSGSVQNLSFSC